MSNYYWDIRISDTLSITRYCKKYRTKQTFISSDLFRINAQKKLLDIWLVYRCNKCATTWNMTIHERVTPQTLDQALYAHYLANDPELAKSCAFNRVLIQKNHVSANFDQLSLNILGPTIEIDALIEPMTVILHCDYDIDIRVEKFLRLKLGLSRIKLKHHIESGKIYHTHLNLLKAKFQRGMSIVLRP